jgi:hypothetical protein
MLVDRRSGTEQHADTGVDGEDPRDEIFSRAVYMAPATRSRTSRDSSTADGSGRAKSRVTQPRSVPRAVRKRAYRTTPSIADTINVHDQAYSMRFTMSVESNQRVVSWPNILRAAVTISPPPMAQPPA